MVINSAITDDRHLGSGLKICAVNCVNILQSASLQLTTLSMIQKKMLWKLENKQQWELLWVYLGPCTAKIWSHDPNTNFWSRRFQGSRFIYECFTTLCYLFYNQDFVKINKKAKSLKVIMCIAIRQAPAIRYTSFY